MVVTISRDAASLLNNTLSRIISKNEDASRQISSAITGLNSCFRSSGVKSPVMTLTTIKLGLSVTNGNTTALKTGVANAINVLYDTDKSCSKYFDKFGNIDVFIEKAMRTAFLLDANKIIHNIIKDKVSDVRKLFGNAVKTAKTTVTNAHKTIKNWFSTIGNNIKETVTTIKNSYDNKGMVYDAVTVFKKGAKLVGGVATVCAGVASIVASGGAATPAAVLAITYGANSAISAAVDIGKIGLSSDPSETIRNMEDTNVLKSLTEGAGGAIGNALGNEELGRKIGTGIYQVGEVASAVASLDLAKDQLVQGLSKVDYSQIGNEIKTGVSGAFDLATKVDVSQVAYQSKLLTYEVPNLIKAADNVSLVSGVVSSAVGSFKDAFKGVVNGNYEVGGLAGEAYDLGKTVAEAVKAGLSGGAVATASAGGGAGF